jgi:hypothetical protein
MQKALTKTNKRLLKNLFMLLLLSFVGKNS